MKIVVKGFILSLGSFLLLLDRYSAAREWPRG
jgi:hypothetical protein